MFCMGRPQSPTTFRTSLASVRTTALQTATLAPPRPDLLVSIPAAWTASPAAAGAVSLIPSLCQETSPAYSMAVRPSTV